MIEVACLISFHYEIEAVRVWLNDGAGCWVFRVGLIFIRLILDN